jgi:hypothetical protein
MTEFLVVLCVVAGLAIIFVWAYSRDPLCNVPIVPRVSVSDTDDDPYDDCHLEQDPIIVPSHDNSAYLLQESSPIVLSPSGKTPLLQKLSSEIQNYLAQHSTD